MTISLPSQVFPPSLVTKRGGLHGRAHLLHPGLQPGTSYDFTMTAVNAVGSGAASNQVSFITATTLVSPSPAPPPAASPSPSNGRKFPFHPINLLAGSPQPLHSNNNTSSYLVQLPHHDQLLRRHPQPAVVRRLLWVQHSERQLGPGLLGRVDPSPHPLSSANL